MMCEAQQAIPSHTEVSKLTRVEDTVDTLTLYSEVQSLQMISGNLCLQKYVLCKFKLCLVST